ncbi:hypothetical protein M885DRAFT_603084 [Pelagophyceae sp. CCMP2097]|nr:hypothetical protein M885DRAFT_603084 [Pelagophyceae sp. CCMP2097]
MLAFARLVRPMARLGGPNSGLYARNGGLSKSARLNGDAKPPAGIKRPRAPVSQLVAAPPKGGSARLQDSLAQLEGGALLGAQSHSDAHGGSILANEDPTALLGEDEALQRTLPPWAIVGDEIVWQDGNGAARRGKIKAAPAGRAGRRVRVDGYTVKLQGGGGSRLVDLAAGAYGRTWWIVGANMGHSIDAANKAAECRGLSNIDDYLDRIYGICALNSRARFPVPGDGHCAAHAIGAGLENTTARSVREAIAHAVADPLDSDELGNYVTDAMIGADETHPNKIENTAARSAAVAIILRRRAKMHCELATTMKTTMVLAEWCGDLDFKAAALPYVKAIYLSLPWGAVQIFAPHRGNPQTLPLSPDLQIPVDALVCVLTPGRDHCESLVKPP